MIRLFIPPLRTKFILLEKWQFSLYTEGRNSSLFDQLNMATAYYNRSDSYGCHPATLPVGTVLSIDRYYIRNGKEEFDSVTFRAWLPGDKKSVRFWAKLDDVNNIMCDIVCEVESADDTNH